MYVNTSSVMCTHHGFPCSVHQVEVECRFYYLELVLSKHFVYDITAKVVAKFDSMTPGLLVVESKIMGGLPFEEYYQLYDAMVWTTISH